MKKTLKILSIVLLAVMMISFVSSTVSMAAIDPSSLTEASGSSTGETKLKETAGKIMRMIRNVAAIASVIIIMVLGVKYMMGSIEEKAEYKKSFMPLIIGIILVNAATTVAGFLFSL